MGARGLFAILVILALQDGRRVCSGGAQSHRSLCEQYHKVNTTQEVSYVETFQKYEWHTYVTATRRNYRQEVVTKWLMVEKCCEGYEPRQRQEFAEDCVPVCPSGCIFGECLRPNVCDCGYGYEAYVNETNGYGDCKPHCYSGCVGGVCVAPDTCSCDPGYTLSWDNATCKPSCIHVGAGGTEDCGANAICAAPNVCQCQEGYAQATGSAADPKVPTTAEQTRTIHDRKEVLCHPVCEPKCTDNASCDAPNQCRCDAGYRWATSEESVINQTCVPICEQVCFNGYCAKPNECRCNEGYAAHAGLGAHICGPICPKGCVNGKCKMPNRCECLEGYAKLILRNDSLGVSLHDNVCLPVCPGLCPNGRCVAPGLCHCDPGYVMASANEEGAVEHVTTTARANDGNASTHSARTCRPFCEPRCGNESMCIAPNRCQPLLPKQGHLHKRLSEPVRIVYSQYDCGPDGHFSDKNGADCTCEYRRGDSDKTCTEPVLCAIIILGNSSAYDRKFDGLESLLFWNDTGGAAVASNNGTGLPTSSHVGFDWASPKCSKECRISILVNKSLEAVRKNDVSCHPLELHDPIIGLVFTTQATLPPSNGSVVCFVKDRFECHHTTSTRTIRVVVWVMVFLNFVLVIVVLTYMNRRKIWKNRFQVSTGANGPMMQRPDGGADSPFHADNDSHL